MTSWKKKQNLTGDNVLKEEANLLGDDVHLIERNVLYFVLYTTHKRSQKKKLSRFVVRHKKNTTIGDTTHIQENKQK